MALGTTFTLDTVIVMLGQDKVDRIAERDKNEIKGDISAYLTLAQLCYSSFLDA